MSTKVDFRQVSDKKCVGYNRKDQGTHNCHRKLKKNLLVRIPGATRCWRCHIRHLGKNPRTLTANGNYSDVKA